MPGDVGEELVVHVAGEGETPGDTAAQLVTLAPKGAKPGGIMAESTQVTAEVTAIDVEHRKATLQFEDGTARTVAVCPDVDLGKRKVGDKVVVRITETHHGNPCDQREEPLVWTRRQQTEYRNLIMRRSRRGLPGAAMAATMPLVPGTKPDDGRRECSGASR